MDNLQKDRKGTDRDNGQSGRDRNGPKEKLTEKMDNLQKDPNGPKEKMDSLQNGWICQIEGRWCFEILIP